MGEKEKLADLLLDVIGEDCDLCPIEEKCFREGCGGSCKGGIMEWLESEADDDGDD